MSTRRRTAYEIQKADRLRTHLRRKPQDAQAQAELDKILRETFVDYTLTNAPKQYVQPLTYSPYNIGYQAQLPKTPTKADQEAAYKLLLDTRPDLEGLFVVPRDQQSTETTKRMLGSKMLLVVDPFATQGLIVTRLAK